MLIGLILNLTLVFAFGSPICVPNFSQIETHISYASYSHICKVCKRKRRKNEWKFYEILLTHILLMAKGISFKLKCGHPCMDIGIKLVSFGGGIMELHMSKNYDFVLSPCKYTLSVYAHLVFLGCMTCYHVSW